MHLVTVSLVSARTKDGVKAAQFNASGHWLYLFNVQKEDLGSYNCIADIMDVELLQALQL